jgi:NIMA (never in mitosis gene a)-related kinase
MITLRPPFRAQNMEGLYNKVCKEQFSRIPDKFSDDLYKVVQFLLQVNPISRPSCEQILNHPIIQKRIEYFKSFAGDDDTEDKCLLKTIHMPKNLLFLSDKLPKPNYDKQFKSSNNNVINVEESHNYRSFNRGKNNENQNNNIKDQIENKDFNKGIHIKKQIKLSPLPNIPEEKRMLKLNSNLIENNKQEILRVGLSNSHSTNNINNTNIRSQERNNSLNNNNQSNIIVNKSSGNISKDNSLSSNSSKGYKQMKIIHKIYDGSGEVTSINGSRSSKYSETFTNVFDNLTIKDSLLLDRFMNINQLFIKSKKYHNFSKWKNVIIKIRRSKRNIASNKKNLVKYLLMMMIYNFTYLEPLKKSLDNRRDYLQGKSLFIWYRHFYCFNKWNNN